MSKMYYSIPLHCYYFIGLNKFILTKIKKSKIQLKIVKIDLSTQNSNLCTIKLS